MQHRNHILPIGLLLLLFGLCLGVQAQEPPLVADREVTDITRITADCVLGIAVTGEPKLSGSFPVDKEGKIHFVLTDDEGGNKQEWVVDVKGVTALEAEKRVTASLKKYLLRPEVRLVIAKLPRLKVEITGPAQKTGTLELPLNSRLSDALTACRYRPNADLQNIRILRAIKGDDKTPTKVRTIEVNFEAFHQGVSEEDPKLEAGDRILIPRLPEPENKPEVKFIQVMGEVEKEGTLPLRAGMTVTEAFQTVGGLKETADKGKIRLMRIVDGKHYEIDAEKAASNDPVHNLTLQGGDVLLVMRRDQTQKFAILGEVEDPKTIDWNFKQRITLLEALELVGGPNKRADLKKLVVRRNYLQNPAQSRELIFDLTLIAKAKQPNIEMEPGDAVFLLPKQKKPSFFQQVFPLVFRLLPFGL